MKRTSPGDPCCYFCLGPVESDHAYFWNGRPICRECNDTLIEARCVEYEDGAEREAAALMRGKDDEQE